jgi:hypothetical protein
MEWYLVKYMDNFISLHTILRLMSCLLPYQVSQAMKSHGEVVQKWNFE